LSGNLTAAGQGVSLVSSGGSIGQTGGIITASTLTGSSGGATSLNKANAITTLQDFTGGTGFSFTNAGELKVPDTIKANNTLALTTNSGDLLITGVLGPVSGSSLNVNLTAATGSILIGDAGFIARAKALDGTDPTLINVTHGMPSSLPISQPDENFVTASNLTVSSPGNVLQQNTSLIAGRGEGMTISNSVTIAGGPEVVDLFLALGSGASFVNTGVAATSGEIFTNRNNNYRVNSCVIGQSGVCTVLSDAIVNIPVDNLTEDLLLKASPESNDTDPTITGAGNEEIWRKRSR